MMSFQWLSSLKSQLCPSRSFRARRKQYRRNRTQFTQTSVSRNAIEALEDRTLLTAFTVVNTNDSGTGSLREAIEQANTNTGADTISFDAALAGQTIVLTDELLISDDLIIVGLGANQLTLDGHGDNRIFNINDGNAETTINVEISGLTLTNGRANSVENIGHLGSGGAIINHENLTVIDSTISDNQASSGGGIINTHGHAELTVIDCFFTRNIATYSGGGISAGYGLLTISGSKFTANSARSGGAIAVSAFYFQQPVVSILNSTFSENSATHSGGAISNGEGYIVIENSLFSKNTATENGGGISSYFGAVKFINSTLIENSVMNSGAGIYSSHGSVSVINSTISENTAAVDGGGIFNSAGSVTLKNSTLSKNFAESNGGGISSSGRLSVLNSTLSENSTNGLGGGIFKTLNNDFYPFTTVVTFDTVISNTTETNNTISSADSLTADRMIYATPDSLTITNSTLIGNSAGSSGGGIFGLDTKVTPTITNSIIAGNTADISPQIKGSFINNTNIIQDSIEGLLDPVLRDNGGPTKTHALLSGSAAINAGNNELALSVELTNDQRGSGFERIFDGIVDIGAFEYNAYSLVVDTLSDEDDGDYTNGQLSLREAIKIANETPEADTITFAAALAGQTIVLTSELLISDDVTITGLGEDQLTISGNNNSRIFNVDDGDAETIINVDISGLTLTNGYADNGGGAILNHENLSVFSSTISKNEAVENGGGIYHAAGLLTINETTFTENLANESGGGIYNPTQDLVVSKSTFYRNVATYSGGGIYSLQGVTKYALREPVNNPEYPIKIALVFPSLEYQYNLVTITGTHFIENSAMSGGGLFSGFTSGPRGNHGWCGNYVLPSSVTTGASQNVNTERSMSEFFLTDSTFARNTANNGGGVFNSAGLVEMERNSIQNNSATYNGGGIYNSGELVIEESTISENTAKIGGGIRNSSGNITIKNSTLSNNSASLYGGGIFQTSGLSILLLPDVGSAISTNQPEVVNSTSSVGDTQHSLSMPILFDDYLCIPSLLLIPSSSLIFINGTITGNSAAQSGGGIASPPGYNQHSTTILTNSIVAGNTAATSPQFEGIFTDNTNIIQDSIDGLLDPILRDNGGPTKTHALVAGSSAINAGNNTAAADAGLTNDQRGTGSARIIDGTVDIGAFEVQTPFAQIDLRVVNSNTSSSNNGERDSLPENLTWIDEWGNYWVEIWISTPTMTDLGILSANLNFTYNTEITTATNIEYGAAFTENQTGTISDLTGTIKNLSAKTNLTDVGDDQRVLFARIKFESTADDSVDLDLLNQSLNPQQLEFSISQPEIILVGDAPSEEVHGPVPETQIYANPYDLNDDDVINFRDLANLISIYNTIPSESNSDYAWFADLNKNNRIDFRDLILLISNFNRTKLNQSTIIYPNLVPLNGNDLLTVNAQTEPQSSQTPITQAAAETVLESAVEQISPQLTPSESEKLDNIDIQIVDLKGDTLGRAIPGTIYIDVNAAGYGWFVDSTPTDHSEFEYQSPLSLIALPDSDAAGRVDLWSVIMHEMGHLLGHEHDDAGLMEETLAPGIRKIPLFDEYDQSPLSENETDHFFTSLKDDSNLIAY